MFIFGVLAFIALALGYFWWDAKQELAKVEQEEVVAEIDISDWETYTNSELGFELKLPDDWEISENFDSAQEKPLVSITNDMGSQILIAPEGYAYGLPLELEVTNDLSDLPGATRSYRNPEGKVISLFYNNYNAAPSPWTTDGFVMLNVGHTAAPCPSELDANECEGFQLRREKLTKYDSLGLQVMKEVGSTIWFPANDPNYTGDEVDVSDWQTYRNEELGFEVMYPSEFMIDEFDGLAVLYQSKVDVSPNSPLDPYGQGLGMAFYDRSDILTESQVFTTEKVMIGREEILAIRAIHDSEIAETLWSTSANQIHSLRINYGYPTLEEKTLDNIELYRHILSTFRFIELLDTSDWPVYRNETFEFKYPPAYEFDSESSEGQGVVLHHTEQKRETFECSCGEFSSITAAVHNNPRNTPVNELPDYIFSEIIGGTFNREHMSVISSSDSQFVFYYDTLGGPYYALLSIDGAFVELSASFSTDHFDSMLGTFQFLN